MLLITCLNFLQHLKWLENEKKKIEHRYTYSVSSFFIFCLICVIFFWLPFFLILSSCFLILFVFLTWGQRRIANQPKPSCHVTQITWHHWCFGIGASFLPTSPFTLSMATICLPFAPFENYCNSGFPCLRFMWGQSI